MADYVPWFDFGLQLKTLLLKFLCILLVALQFFILFYLKHQFNLE